MSSETVINTEFCEVCGAPKTTTEIHTHHIHHRASGGIELKENKIALCWQHHTEVHAGKIPRAKLVEIVAIREEKTPEEICEIIGLLVEKVMPWDYVLETGPTGFVGKSLEEVLQAMINCEEIGEEALWLHAEQLSALVDAGLSIKQVSSLSGKSPATIRERVRTYKAFPNKEKRAIDKTFTHHRYASKTDDPEKWMQLVCEKSLSTRQLEEAIKAEGQNTSVVKDLMQEKAERSIRMIKEVLEQGGDVAAWIKEEILKIEKEFMNGNGDTYGECEAPAGDYSQSSQNCA